MSNNFRPRQYSLDQRRKRKSGCGCIGPMLLALVIVAIVGIVYFRSIMQSYSSLDARIKVAQVCAYSTPASPPKMYVHVILYGNDGNITFEKHYQVPGNQVQLQGDVIKYWPGLNPLLQSGYKLTSLEGYYNDPNIERNYKPEPIPLNGGDDNFYKTVHGLPSVTPAIEAIYDKPLSLMGDGQTYDIIVSQDGPSASKVNSPLACGLNPQPTS